MNPSISRTIARFSMAMVAVALLTLISSAARAEEPRATRWYGYEGVVTDFLAVGLFFEGAVNTKICLEPFGASAGDRSCDNSVAQALLLGGTALYGFGGPVSHAARGH